MYLEKLRVINRWQERGINDADFHRVRFFDKRPQRFAGKTHPSTRQWSGRLRQLSGRLCSGLSNFGVMNTALGQPVVSKRRARLSIGAFFFMAGLCFASWASRIPDIKLYLKLSDAGLGGVLLALPVGLMISLPFSGWLVHHFGSRKMVLLSAVLYASVLSTIGLVLSLIHI